MVGAVESALTVKFELELEPAPFAASTDFVPGSAAPATKLYVRDAPLPEALQEAPIAPADGKVYEAMPVSPSVERGAQVEASCRARLEPGAGPARVETRRSDSTT